ncbi:MAG: M48 family metalloprotease [Rickettsiales bacterium]|jgi:predicted Zn-dependent protease|nr:M48 family metalloprotease [Rickettsiales bacterium]
MRKLLFLLPCVLFIPARFAAAEIRDTEIESVISEIIRPVADAANIKPKIHIIQDNALNAFTRGGTDIFVNTGLLTKIDDPAELAAVVAHEIGHANLGHMAQMGAKMRAETTRSLLLGIGLIALNPQAAAGVMAGASGMAIQSMLAFTRDEERAADDYAAKILARANIDPAALLSVFQKMQSSREGKINPNNINHPLTEERIKNIKLQIANGGGKKTNGETGAAPRSSLRLVQAKLIGYLEPNRVKTLYPDSDKTDAALYARAIARMGGGDLGTAKTGTLTLIARNKTDPYFYELLGDIEFQFGHYDDSVRAYDESLKNLAGNKTQIEIALALVLSERRKPGDAERAAGLCKKSILAEQLPLAYWVLAKTDEKRADYYLAEYHYLSGDAKRAKQHARAAVKKLDKNSPEYMKAKDIADIE